MLARNVVKQRSRPSFLAKHVQHILATKEDGSSRPNPVIDSWRRSSKSRSQSPSRRNRAITLSSACCSCGWTSNDTPLLTESSSARRENSRRKVVEATKPYDPSRTEAGIGDQNFANVVFAPTQPSILRASLMTLRASLRAHVTRHALIRLSGGDVVAATSAMASADHLTSQDCLRNPIEIDHQEASSCQ